MSRPAPPELSTRISYRAEWYRTVISKLGQAFGIHGSSHPVLVARIRIDVGGDDVGFHLITLHAGPAPTRLPFYCETRD
jgi:hypothetical protein